jgi:NAD(P)-dependent dehydrogenase (short-subunit alcohol dehydrogenase family)
MALPFYGLYGATKFALEGLTESYRDELAPFGIDAAIIEPGTYPTPIGAKHQVAADTERAALYQSAMEAFMTPFQAENRSATPPNPQEVADAVASIIALPAGKRPLHTVVAPVAQREAPAAVNDVSEEATASWFQRLDLPLASIMPMEEHQEQAH